MFKAVRNMIIGSFNKRETAVIRQSQGRRAARRLFNAVRSGYEAITSDYRAAMS